MWDSILTDAQIAAVVRAVRAGVHHPDAATVRGALCWAARVERAGSVRERALLAAVERGERVMALSTRRSVTTGEAA